MYKLLLSWKYLRTRFLAFASIISVMLGVATLIVVNSVMGGFANKLVGRIRGLHADIIVEYRSQDGMRDATGKQEKIRKLLGEKLKNISPVIETYGMLQYRLKGHADQVTRPVRIMGVDGFTKAQTGEFAKTLLDPGHREDPGSAFQVDGKALDGHRRLYSYTTSTLPRGLAFAPGRVQQPDADAPPPPEPAIPPTEEMQQFGTIVGYGIAHYRRPGAKVTDTDKDDAIIYLGQEINLTMVSSNDLESHDGTRGGAKPITAKFVVTDFSKSEMGEMDGNLLYVDLKDLQRLRGMHDRATSLHIRLENFDRDSQYVLQLLEQEFHPDMYLVQTWKDKQGPILSAIAIERSILNILLFLIIAVAGFGILAIFFMIVVEKTRDIGILKALGASNHGVMSIFLGYGLTLGIVGAGFGTMLGVTITVYINEIEKVLSQWTGQEIFDRGLYYFEKIPTELNPTVILMVNLGAVFIAVGSSVFPALRAAMLHPVRALRYE